MVPDRPLLRLFPDHLPLRQPEAAGWPGAGHPAGRGRSHGVGWDGVLRAGRCHRAHSRPPATAARAPSSTAASSPVTSPWTISPSWPVARWSRTRPAPSSARSRTRRRRRRSPSGAGCSSTTRSYRGRARGAAPPPGDYRVPRPERRPRVSCPVTLRGRTGQCASWSTSGFTVAEVVVAVAVLSVGLLALAGSAGDDQPHGRLGPTGHPSGPGRRRAGRAASPDRVLHRPAVQRPRLAQRQRGRRPAEPKAGSCSTARVRRAGCMIVLRSRRPGWHVQRHRAYRSCCAATP